MRKAHALGVELHADHKAVLMDEPLVDPVGADAGFEQAAPQPSGGLMVRAVHAEPLAVQPLQERVAGAHRMHVIACITERDVARRIGNILNQVAAERDVEHLMPAADAEDRPPACEEAADERELVAVAAVVDAAARGVFLPVEGGVHIGAAGQEQAAAALGVGGVHGEYGLRAAGGECGRVVGEITAIAADKNGLHRIILSAGFSACVRSILRRIGGPRQTVPHAADSGRISVHAV